jgi:deoxyribonuclease-1
MSLSRAQYNLMQAWNNRHPVSPWECERDRRIEKVQGWSNHFVSDLCQ